MAEKIEAWRSTDGQIWATEAQASARDEAIKFGNARTKLHRFLQGNALRYSSISDIAEWMLNNRADLLPLLAEVSMELK
jgi:hypothetical protein